MHEALSLWKEIPQEVDLRAASNFWFLSFDVL
jgi:hypothetical protein